MPADHGPGLGGGDHVTGIGAGCLRGIQRYHGRSNGVGRPRWSPPGTLGIVSVIANSRVEDGVHDVGEQVPEHRDKTNKHRDPQSTG